jgi:mRNA interferase HigB
MHVISASKLKNYCVPYPNAEPALRKWLKVTEKANWNDFVETRQTFPSADLVENLTVFNIAGNNFRLIAYIDYERKKVFIRKFLTHSDYDKGDWKKDPWFK